MSAPSAAQLAMLASPAAHLPTEPAIWSAPVVPANSVTSEYSRFTPAQLLAQMEQMERDPAFALYAPLFVRIRSTLDFCKQQLRRYQLIHTAFSFNGGKDCTVLLHLLRLAFEALANEDAGAAAAAAAPAAPAASAPAAAPSPPAAASAWRLSDLTCIYFKEANEFSEISSFMCDMSSCYSLQLAHMSGSFKGGLVALQNEKPIRAIFMGQRAGDPGCTVASVAKSDKGWPEFDRINPLIEWTYHDVWAFLRLFRLPYCALYDQGYTSLGHRFNTAQCPALAVQSNVNLQLPAAQPAAQGAPSASEACSIVAVRYRPAWQLEDASREREGRFSTSIRGMASPIPGVGAPSPTPTPSPAPTPALTTPSPPPAAVANGPASATLATPGPASR